MPAYSLVVLAAFTFLGLGTVIFVILRPRGGKKINFLGVPTIQPVFFYTAKISLFVSWGYLLTKALRPDLGSFPVPAFLSWTGAILMCLATVMLILAFFGLGDSLRVGLPQEETSLKTTGIFRVSRNPIYTGIHMVCIASVLFFPNIFNLLFAFYGMIVHHNIIKSEEKFLAGRFGAEWSDYTHKVRRYL
jgi:protein-S-isoprenylcysteine O-methyltransferase Ste14